MSLCGSVTWITIQGNTRAGTQVHMCVGPDCRTSTRRANFEIIIGLSATTQISRFLVENVFFGVFSTGYNGFATSTCHKTQAYVIYVIKMLIFKWKERRYWSVRGLFSPVMLSLQAKCGRCEDSLAKMSKIWNYIDCMLPTQSFQYHIIRVVLTFM